MNEPRVIHIAVGGQRYPIKTTLEGEYVQRLAAYVDQKMKAAADASPSSDAVGLAVLTALNIADEFFRARLALADDAEITSQKAEDLERLIDEALQGLQ